LREIVLRLVEDIGICFELGFKTFISMKTSIAGEKSEGSYEWVVLPRADKISHLLEAVLQVVVSHGVQVLAGLCHPGAE